MLDGSSHQDYVTATNAMEARALVMESNDQIKHRPNAIKALLRLDKVALVFWSWMAIFEFPDIHRSRLRLLFLKRQSIQITESQWMENDS